MINGIGHDAVGGGTAQPARQQDAWIGVHQRVQRADSARPLQGKFHAHGGDVLQRRDGFSAREHGMHQVAA